MTGTSPFPELMAKQQYGTLDIMHDGLGMTLGNESPGPPSAISTHDEQIVVPNAIRELLKPVARDSWQTS